MRDVHFPRIIARALHAPDGPAEAGRVLLLERRLPMAIQSNIFAPAARDALARVFPMHRQPMQIGLAKLTAEIAREDEACESFSSR